MTSPYDPNKFGTNDNARNAGAPGANAHTSSHSNAQQGASRKSRTNNRMSVPGSREELERESRAYSSNRGAGSWDHESAEAPARARATAQFEEKDYMAPFRKGGQASAPQRRYADTSSAHYRSEAEGSRPSIRRQDSAGQRPSVRNGASRPSVRQQGTSGRPSVRRKNEAQTYRDRATSQFSADEVARSNRRANDYTLDGSGNDQQASRSASLYSRQNADATGRYRAISEAQEERANAGLTGSMRAISSHARQQASGNGGDGGRFVPMGTPGSAPRDHRRSNSGGIRKLVFGAVAVVAVVAIGVFGFQNWDANRPIHIILNDQEVSVEGSQRSIEGLLDAGTVTVNAGNYVAVDGSTIRQGEGYRATAKINGEQTEDLTTHLYEGDKVKVADGEDIMEPYTDTDEKSINYSTKIEGSGPIHIYTSKGEKGTKVTRTGQESGITKEVVTKEATDTVMTKYHLDTKGDKVICLTFDDGPWPTTTEEILDILEDNNAKATFFTIGNQIANHTDSIKRMMDAGHQICTHTYDHAAGSGKGVNITYMSKKEQQQEIEKGYSCIKEVTGSDASTVVRLPGGNLDEKTAANLKDLITCEVGWSLDTQDWSKPGADSIYNVLMQAEGGSVILMHDGGGDRSQTVTALKKALPKLAAKGYSFITLDEMLSKYPYEASSDSSSSTASSSTTSSTDSVSSSSDTSDTTDTDASSEEATKEDE